jgi:hypothetical protein
MRYVYLLAPHNVDGCEPHIPSRCCSKTEGKSWVVERWQMWTP